MKKIVFTLAFISIVFVSYASTQKDSSGYFILEILERDNLKIYKKKSKIPLAIKKYWGEEFSISNPNQKYAAGLRLESSLPRRQLNFIVNSGNDWVIVYKHGGKGVHIHIAYFEINSESQIIKKWGGVDLEDIDDIDDLRRIINKNSYSRAICY